MRRQHCRYVAALLIFGNLCQARLLQGALATVRPGFRTTSMMSARGMDFAPVREFLAGATYGRRRSMVDAHFLFLGKGACEIVACWQVLRRTEPSCSYQIVKSLTQFVASYGQVGDATVISSLLIAGNCRAIFKDGEKSYEIFLGMCGRGDARIRRPDARRDRRARKGRLRTKRLSSGLSVPLAMACRPTRQILQYRALGLRHGRWPAGLSLTRRFSPQTYTLILSSNCRVARRDFRVLQQLHKTSPGSAILSVRGLSFVLRRR